MQWEEIDIEEDPKEEHFKTQAYRCKINGGWLWRTLTPYPIYHYNNDGIRIEHFFYMTGLTFQPEV